jgi:SCF-associated factor 1
MDPSTKSSTGIGKSSQDYSKFLDLADELILRILALLPHGDLLSLSCTNHRLNEICEDEILWRNKLQDDFNFPVQSTARISGWKAFYRSLKRPNVYTWGLATFLY